jgi:hypothetical protein
LVCDAAESSEALVPPHPANVNAAAPTRTATHSTCARRRIAIGAGRASDREEGFIFAVSTGSPSC